MQRRTFLVSAAATAATSSVAGCGAKRIGETPPQDLVSFGSKFELMDGAGAGQIVRLTMRPAPVIELSSGALAIADPWFRDALPRRALIDLPRGRQPTLLSTIAMKRKGKPATIACAAAIGRVDWVAEWRPLLQDRKAFWLDSDSALGAFYDMADAPRLHPIFEQDDRMQQVYERVLDEQIATMDAIGREAAAAVFLCPDGSATYPVYAGFDRSAQAIAVLVDLKILNPGREWNSLTPARRISENRR